MQEPRPITVPSMVLDNPVQGMNPRKWICRLIVHSIKPDGRHVQWTGSAFKVKISPNVGHTVLFTAAHVTRKGHIRGKLRYELSETVTRICGCQMSF